MKPLLAHTYEPHRITYPCYVQPKLNGVRALYQDGCFQSRDELPWNEGILSHIARELQAVIYNPSFILDGELYVHGWPLQRINGAVTPVRIEAKRDTAEVQYHVFDRACFVSSFADRFLALKNIIGNSVSVRLVETRLVHSPNEADACYAEWVSQGYEGMMYRLGDCQYTTPKCLVDTRFNNGIPQIRSNFAADKNNRTWHLLKRKNWLDEDYEITDFQLTIGDKGEPGFQLFCRTPTGRTFSVGSGLSDSERDYYASNSPVGRKAKVKYLCLSQDGIPLNPTILAIL